jgi:ATP synthase F1 delta subunit
MMQRLVASKQTVMQLLVGSTRACMVVQPAQRFSSVVNVETREFSTKKKKGKKGPGEASDAEQTSAEEPAASYRNVEALPTLDKALYQPFSLGDVKKIQSTPDH